MNDVKQLALGKAVAWLHLSVLTRRLLIWLTILVVLVLVNGILSLRLVLDLEHIVTHMVRGHLQGAVHLAEANDALWRLRYEFPQFMVGNSDERDRILAEEPALYEKLAKQLDLYAATISSDDEKQKFEALKVSYLRYIAARPKWFELYVAGRIDEAREYRSRTTTPYGAETVAHIARQIVLQQSSAGDAFNKVSSEIFDWKRNLIVSVGGVALTILGLFMVGSRALLQLRNLHIRAQTIATRLFGPAAVTTSNNEIEALASSFDALNGQFEAHNEGLKRANTELEKAAARMDHRAADAGKLQEMSNRLQACQTIDEAKAAFAIFAPQLLPASRGRLYVINASQGIVDDFAAWGEPIATENTHFRPDECWALRRSATHTSGAGFNDMRCTHLDAASGGATLCEPIMSLGNPIGVLCIELPQSADDDTAATAVSTASVVGMAIANLQLRGKLRTQSIVDPLTGLYNRRFLDETLEREIARSTRRNLPLAVLMADIDHFKRFNDTHGHDAGDEALRGIAASMRSMFRSSDVLCRFGGEEFLIVLPEADVPAALAIANEWRAGLVRQPPITFRGGVLPPSRPRWGLPSFPSMAVTPKS